MACDSTEQMRAEYGPFHTRMEAEIEARKLGFEYLLRYEHIVGKNDEIQEVRSIFIELQEGSQTPRLPVKLHTRCASCGESATHDAPWRAEVWADTGEGAVDDSHDGEVLRHLLLTRPHPGGSGSALTAAE